MDYRARVARLTDIIHAEQIDLLAVPPGDDLRYLTGYSPLADERPCYLLLADDTRLFLVPALNADQAERHLRTPFLTYSDAAGPHQALAAAREQLGPRRRIGVGDTMRADALLLLQRTWGEAEFVPASTVLAPLRMRKSVDEIAALRRVAETADRAMDAAWRAARAGAAETDVAAAAERGFREAGAEEVKFVTVGSGPNSAFHHHHTGPRRLAAGEPVLYDLGSRLAGYCSDITRMAFLGLPSPRYRDVHRVVDEAVQAALAVIKPGAPISDVDLAARRVIEQAGYGQYFVHRTGHGIGLSEHEPPSITHTNAMLLAEGMAFSVEPGIYLPGEFGVRLEEIVVVTPRGPEVLSRLPRDVRIIA